MSIKPGATTIPRASIVRERGAPARLPIAAIFPPRSPMSPECHGDPVPSMMRPLTMTMSNPRGEPETRGSVPVNNATQNAATFERIEVRKFILGSYVDGAECEESGGIYITC